ncbi:unnamed protein product [Cladocopium goreaui]|uniref:Secreted protein n=1 Tax=Cladocopium goreaui TaxID=2562237 RepID=A0A9P1DRI8_9DINO|nr:unnamed protein product [Cladocopium goreaui]
MHQFSDFRHTLEIIAFLIFSATTNSTKSQQIVPCFNIPTFLQSQTFLRSAALHRYRTRAGFYHAPSHSSHQSTVPNLFDIRAASYSTVLVALPPSYCKKSGKQK